ncbi:hypothetical protein [Foetidibacter luteolus]|uniref:hypothetical protein n=1 Tax=Foetidibacter luteolus TaxID=2608880 RepID=UPI00129BAB6F|nr:hypothetical protein [Foetidibacter luteolus]
MSISKNWRAWYSTHFSGNALIVQGEIKRNGSYRIIPAIQQYNTGIYDDRFLHLQLLNAGAHEFMEVREVFFPDSAKITTVYIYNEEGAIELAVPLTKDPDLEMEDILSGEFYDD